ncbi:MAG: hypothetical protein WBM07_07815 [Chitinivibrionales bacterium]
MKINSVYALLFVAIIFSACGSRQTVKVSETPDDKKGAIIFSGGAGDSYETAIVLKSANRAVKKQEDAVAGEYDYISSLYGKRDKEWVVEEQSMVKENNRVYDMVRVKIVQNDKMHFFYFDITEFSKKMPTPPQ